MNNVQRTDPNYEAVYLQYIYMCVCVYYGYTYTCVYSIYVKTAGGTDATLTEEEENQKTKRD